jgi:hypothetical protein
MLTVNNSARLQADSIGVQTLTGNGNSLLSRVESSCARDVGIHQRREFQKTGLRCDLHTEDRCCWIKER